MRATLVAALLCGSAAVGWWYGQPQQQGEPAAKVAPKLKSAPHLPRFATFAGEQPTPDVRHVADWALDSGDAGGRSYVVIDKQQAHVWLFDPQGVLVAHTPSLIGSAVGDDAVPGIGEKPLSQIQPEEKTTPAGRFVAEPGVNAQGEDIVWVSYDLAVSMHRVRANVKAERRLERLASETPDDNRISFGCINLPVDFYEHALLPAVRGTGAVVYVLPETRPVQQQFGSYDVATRWRGTRTAPA
ncbi:hypothetical protein [Ramlibacter henchirensis]|uniref:hypothetical protein n=1 Tax=Ramlibacter henchirensis TaxID=204072 RepID=UPI00197D6685|nr:hypothetical protein [Ramlibacter henchirensis]